MTDCEPRLIRERIRGGPAKGTRESDGHPKISVRFEQDMFDRINNFAEQSMCSFGDAVRLLVGHAFECLDRESAAPGERATGTKP